MVNIDGDMQFNPADIAILVQPLLRDEADFVTCSRFADPALRPTMPGVKFYGNAIVTRIINWVCGGTTFSDVSCGFRAFNREAAYRMTLFGRFTYTQECFIDLFSKGLRITEVPLKVRGVREHGKSRIASSIWKYATNSLPIILRAMRDIQPLKFFGGIGMMFFAPGHPRRPGRDHPLRRRPRENRNHRRCETYRPRPPHVAVHQLDSHQRRAGHAGLNVIRPGAARRHARPAPADHRRAAPIWRDAASIPIAERCAPRYRPYGTRSAKRSTSNTPTRQNPWARRCMRNRVCMIRGRCRR